MTSATMAAKTLPVRMLGEIVRGPRAWTAATLPPEAWRVTIPAECLAELRAVLCRLRREALPLFLLDPADYPLEACRALMSRVRQICNEGAMFAVLDRLPMEEMSRDESVMLYWLLSNLLSRPVAQKYDGTMIYLVRDTGAKLQPGSGIRPTVTNVDLTFHNDNSYNETPPDYVALLCQQSAWQGGVSRVMSVYTIHNALLECRPEVMPRLYRPFWYDRHREHGADEPQTHAAPIFEHDGTRLRGRFALFEIYGGYALRGEAMDRETSDALAAVQEVFETPELRLELGLEPGQIQYVNNRLTGHARTEFVDRAEPEKRRQLVRLWLRDGGKRSYRG